MKGSAIARDIEMIDIRLCIIVWNSIPCHIQTTGVIRYFRIIPYYLYRIHLETMIVCIMETMVASNIPIIRYTPYFTSDTSTCT